MFASTLELGSLFDGTLPRPLTHTFRNRSEGASIMSQREFVSEGQGVAAVEYEDRSIKCVDCGEDFIWTGGEQVFFHDKGLKNEPKRCKP